MERLITVSGSGSVTVAPDCARLTLGVQVRGVDAQDALRRSNEAIASIITTVRDHGVEPADLRTNGPNLWSGEQGYTGSNDVTLLVRDLAAVGPLIDAVAGSGGPDLTMHGVSFSVLDPTPHRDAARRLAVDEARRVARDLADAAGVSVGEVIAIVEGSPAPVVPIGARGAAMMKAAATPTPVESGSHEIRADVTVTFRLADA